MANPNKSPNKGFAKELASAQSRDEQSKAFDWKKPVAHSGTADSLNTPRRLANHSPVAKPKSNFASETRKVSDKRSGKC